MIEFNSETMTLAKVRNNFIIEDDDVAILSFDLQETVEAQTGDVCWIFKDVQCHDYSSIKMVFAYFPEIGIATPVREDLIDINGANGKQKKSK